MGAGVKDVGWEKVAPVITDHIKCLSGESPMCGLLSFLALVGLRGWTEPGLGSVSVMVYSFARAAVAMTTDWVA